MNSYDSIDIPIEVKRTLLAQELGLHKNTLFIMAARHEVAEALKQTERMEAIQNEMAEHLRAVKIYEKKLALLEASVPNGDKKLKEPPKVEEK
jgi:hypothetical protein